MINNNKQNSHVFVLTTAIFIIPPYANKVKCAILLVKSKEKDRTVCSIYPLGQQLSYCQPHGLTLSVQWC